MADQNHADKLGAISNVYSVADIAWAAIQDKFSHQPIGTTATTRYGAMSSAFGIAEQLEIWNSSAKNYEDFERFVIGMGTNAPGAVGYGLMPKKWFDDHFDRGRNEAETLRKLLDAGKRLSSITQPIDDMVNKYFDGNGDELKLSHSQRDVVLARIKENAINSIDDDLIGAEAGDSGHSEAWWPTSEQGR